MLKNVKAVIFIADLIHVFFISYIIHLSISFYSIYVLIDSVFFQRIQGSKLNIKKNSL